MRVLLEESVPRQLAPLLTGHSVTTVPLKGWAARTNGGLLRRASEQFDALVTGDQSLQHQQTLADLPLGVVVLAAPNNWVETITSMSESILEPLAQLRPGQVVRVAA